MLDSAIHSPGGRLGQVRLDRRRFGIVRLKADGVEFKNDIVEQGGRKQILCQDLSGNVVELFQGA